MIGKLNENGRKWLRRIVIDPNSVKIWGMLTERNGGKRYCVQANWDGCTHPNHYEGIEYVHPEIKNDKKNTLSGGYWISGDVFEYIVPSYANNRQAKGILSSEY